MFMCCWELGRGGGRGRGVMNIIWVSEGVVRSHVDFVFKTTQSFSVKGLNSFN